MFAEELPQTREKAFDNLNVVCTTVCEGFAAAFEAEDRRVLDAARKLRNKLIHCEFWTAEQLIETHSGPLATMGSVYTSDPVMGVRTNREMDKSEARIYGWLMEAAEPEGMFERAEAIFSDAIRVLRKTRHAIAMTET